MNKPQRNVRHHEVHHHTHNKSIRKRGETKRNKKIFEEIIVENFPNVF